MNIINLGSLKSGSGLSRSHVFFDALNMIALTFPIFLLVFTWRGFMQAIAARIMGDRTAQRNGFLTLNPFAHVDIMGLGVVLCLFLVICLLFSSFFPQAILIILLIALGIRWTIPVPIDESQFRHHRLGGIVTSVSGSLGNFFLAFIAAGVMKALLNPHFPSYVLLSLVQIFDTLIYIAIFFGVMDLTPLPPFDGGRLLYYVLPQSMRNIVYWLEEYSLYIFLILFLLPVVSDIFFNILIVITMAIKKQIMGIFF